MGNKGFTLIEMLAVVLILSIIMGIATNGVISYINTSKIKSEKIFVDKIANYIDSYIALYGSSMNTIGNEYTFKKRKKLTKNNDELECIDSNSYDVTAIELNSFSLDKITEGNNSEGYANLVEKDDLVNPGNKKKCFDETNNPLVRVFRDSDYVYYYYVDLSNNGCEIHEENKIINNIPDNLCASIKNKGVNLECGA